MGMADHKKRSRAVSGGKAAAITNRWYHLRKVVGHDDAGREVLECGHAQRARSDMIGEYEATRRRCHQCPKPTVPCDTCNGTGAAMRPGYTVPLRCPECDGDGRLLVKVSR